MLQPSRRKWIGQGLSALALAAVSPDRAERRKHIDHTLHCIDLEDRAVIQRPDEGERR